MRKSPRQRAHPQGWILAILFQRLARILWARVGLVEVLVHRQNHLTSGTAQSSIEEGGQNSHLWTEVIPMDESNNAPKAEPKVEQQVEQQ